MPLCSSRQYRRNAGALLFGCCLLVLASLSQAAELRLCYGKSELLTESGGPLGDVLTNLFARVDPELELALIIMPWPRCQVEAAAGEMDGVMRMLKTPEREQFFDFSTPLSEYYGYFVYLAESFPAGLEWENPADLAGLRVGTLRGNPVSPQFQRLIEDGVLNWQLVADDTQLMKMLATDRLDVVVLDGTASEPVYRSGEVQTIIGARSLKAMKKPYVQARVSVALSKRSPMLHLLPEINQALEQMRERGELAPLQAW